MFTHFNKITLQINVKVSCCAPLKYVIMFPVQKRGNRAVGKEKGIEKKSVCLLYRKGKVSQRSV